MLYRIEIRNFMSVRDPLVLDFRVKKGVPEDSVRFQSIFSQHANAQRSEARAEGLKPRRTGRGIFEAQQGIGIIASAMNASAGTSAWGSLNRPGRSAGADENAIGDRPEQAVLDVFDEPALIGRVPKRVIFFGANASGKSTILRAVTLALRFVTGEISWDAGKRSPFEPFATPEGESNPTVIKLSAYGSLTETRSIATELTYELHIKHVWVRDLAGPVSSGDFVSLEKLTVRDPGGRSRRAFERTLNENSGEYEYFIGPDFELKNTDPRLGYVAAGRSLASVLANFNHSLSQRIIKELNFYSNLLTFGSFTQDMESATAFYTRYGAVLDELKRRVGILDLGIESIEIVTSGTQTFPMFRHHGLGAPLPYVSESEGTKAFYNMFPVINFGIRGGFTIIDEIDRDLHPLVLPEILRWYCESSESRSQLMATCQNPYVLETLVKEEVVLVEKDRTGNTSATTLAEMPGTRRDLNLYSKYLSGVLGGVPRIG